ncbi:hypothetical protein QMT40_001587 [Parvibaculaceae bacterium PLY_AMNH_Bact1]|nr:hypothetical protein QMT40_001587 [Parvibaculaceae bacterium PLY_AMNH_Bact1]
MLFLRRQFFTAAVLLTAIGVFVNFARPAPIVLEGEEVDTAYVSEEAEEISNADAGPKCPCPTEIEKTDCDEGLCSVGLTSIVASLTSGRVYLPDAFMLESGRAAGNAPDPDPPRIDV